MLEVMDKVFKGAKALRDLAKKIENVELQNEIADLIGNTADLKLEVAQLKSELIDLKNENAALKTRADVRGRIVIKDRLCYMTEPLEGYNEGPFCPICFEKDGILINVWESTLGYCCPNCDKKP